MNRKFQVKELDNLEEVNIFLLTNDVGSVFPLYSNRKGCIIYSVFYYPIIEGLSNQLKPELKK